MFNFFKNFTTGEDGAITVDWVVLTAAIAALATICFWLIRDGSEAFAQDVNEALSDVSISISTGDSNGTAGGILVGGSN